MERAKLGDAKAQFSLGNRYRNGDGVERRPTLAIDWWEKAAEQGLPEAEHNLGVCYLRGLDVVRSEEKANEYFHRAAMQDHLLAQWHLGVSLEFGRGIQKNLEEAAIWYRKAAAAGSGKAIERLATIEREKAARQQEIVDRKRRAQANRKRAEATRLAREHAERERAAAERERAAAERERAAAERERKEKVDELLRFADTQYKQGFLGADSRIRQHPLRKHVSDGDLRQRRVLFVQNWVRENLGEQFVLDEEQADAVGTLGSDLCLVARAGAGKTRTLVTRALFLLKHCGVSASEVLILAFNRKAAQEIRNRIEAHCEKKPFVMTLDALAYALVHPKENLVVDDPFAQRSPYRVYVGGIIDDMVKSPDYGEKIREMMLAYFKSDWDEMLEGKGQLSREDFLKVRRSRRHETLAGETVKSGAEKIIANTLFEHGIEYGYEWSLSVRGESWHPDFTVELPDGRVLILEYFGLQGDPDYDEQTAWKRNLMREPPPNHVFDELGPVDRPNLEMQVLLILTGLGVSYEKLSEDEIWEKIKDRAIGDFDKIASGFVMRGRQLNWSHEYLRDRITAHDAENPAEEKFLPIAVEIYRRYLEELPSDAKEDFPGLCWRVVDRLARGKSHFSRKGGREAGDVADLRYVFVDEFQDFSQRFYALWEGIRRLNQEVEFFGVGDDWQSINRFAGADVKYFQEFETHFTLTPRRLELPMNYRSGGQIVELGNKVMVNQGTPARPRSGALPDTIKVADLSAFSAEPPEIDLHEKGPRILLLRMLQYFLREQSDVVLLARTNNIPRVFVAPRGSGKIERFADELRKVFSADDRERIKVSTVHGFKGKESDVVILLDADDRRYPLLHPQWFFQRIFGESLEKLVQDDRRLFYVALTRAHQYLYFFSREAKSLSSFLRGPQVKPIESMKFERLPTLSEAIGEAQSDEIRIIGVSPTDKALHSNLKGDGFRWNPKGKYWWRMVERNQFTIRKLARREWFRAALGVEILREGKRIDSSGDKAPPPLLAR